MAVIFGARHLVADVDGELEKLSIASKNLGVEIQVLDAHMVFGMEHIEIALEKTERAFDQGRNIAKTRGTELMLYAGAERQISKAIEKMGLKPGIEELAVIIIGQHNNSDLDKIMAELGWERDDSVLEPGAPEDIDIILEELALSELDR